MCCAVCMYSFHVLSPLGSCSVHTLVLCVWTLSHPVLSSLIVFEISKCICSFALYKYTKVLTNCDLSMNVSLSFGNQILLICIHFYTCIYWMYIMYLLYLIQCNFSKPNSFGTKEMVQFREVSGLERFCMYSKYREQDLKTCPV